MCLPVFPFFRRCCVRSFSANELAGPCFPQTDRAAKDAFPFLAPESFPAPSSFTQLGDSVIPGGRGPGCRARSKRTIVPSEVGVGNGALTRAQPT